ncbi:uncharacterized protein [Macrobrachium rosenbergii]|uniref:uncharacterized protein n=1 Tax=Macrobrachium rosenbergii TaxID=79674 RepID=UPI0034D770BB
MGWPEDKWSVLLQSVLIGKGRSAYSALLADQCKEYKVLKHNGLQVYQMTPEHCNERFRSLRKDDKITFLDYAYKVRKCFKRWLEAAKIKTFEDLEVLVVLEQYLRGIPKHIRAYLREREVNKLDKDAMLSEDYNIISSKRNYNVEYQNQRIGFKSHPNFKSRFNGNPTSDNAKSVQGNIPQQANVKSSYNVARQLQKPSVICYKCGKAGHFSWECYQTHQQSKPVGQVVRGDQERHRKRVAIIEDPLTGTLQIHPPQDVGNV